MILIGANDACLEGSAGSQHVPLEKYKENMESIIAHPAVQAQGPRIIVISPPPINEHVCLENDKLKGFHQPRRHAEHTKKYALAAQEVADRLQLPFIDLYELFLNHAGGTKNDRVLQGSVDLPPNPFIRMLLHDGKNG